MSIYLLKRKTPHAPFRYPEKAFVSQLQRIYGTIGDSPSKGYVTVNHADDIARFAINIQNVLWSAPFYTF